MRFRRVLSALWSERKASYEGFCLVAGPARGHLAPFGGLLVAKKVVIVHIFTSLGSILQFWWHPGKSIFFTFSTHFGATGAPPGGARSRFRRFLSLLWSKRVSAQGSFFFGQDLAGTVWGLMVASWGSEKSSLGQISFFVGSFFEFLWHPGKVILFMFL